MGSQRVRHDWATELNWAECNVLEVGKSKIRILAWYLGFLVRALFFIHRWIPPYCVFLWCRETLPLHCVSYKGTNPIQKALPSWPAHPLVHVHAQSLLSFPALCNPMECSPTGFSAMGFSRQEYWSGLSCPPPGNLPDPGIEPRSHMSPALAGRFFTTNATWEAPNLLVELPPPYIITLGIRPPTHEFWGRGANIQSLVPCEINTMG